VTDTAAIYCRISADPENTADGVRRQEAACRKLAMSRGYGDVQIHRDNDISAVAASRPAYSRLLGDVSAGRIGIVLAWKADRLYRDITDQDALRGLLSATGTQLETVKGGRVDLTTADGRMRAREDASRAQWELETIKERTLAAKIDAAEQGRWRGGKVPLGYKLADGQLVIDPEPAAAVKAAAQGISAGRTVTSVARELNARLGLTMRPTAVRLLLLRRSIAGLVERHGEVVGEAQWPRILTREESDQVRAILLDPDRRSGPGPSRRHLGSGLFVSSVDGSPVYPSGGSRNGVVSYAATGVNRRTDLVDTFVCAAIAERLQNPSVVESLAARSAPVVSAARAELDGLQARVRTLVAMFADGEIDREQLTSGTRPARARLASLEAELAAAAKISPSASVIAAEVPSVMFLEADIEIQRAVIDLLCTVVIHPATQGRPAGWKSGPYASANGVEIKWKA
jgi:site-specific DNA recombinase